MQTATDEFISRGGKVFQLVECELPESERMGNEERQPYVMFATYPDVMTREQAAEALGMNVKDMGELLIAGKVRAYRDGRRWRVPKVSLIEYVERRIERGCRR